LEVTGTITAQSTTNQIPHNALSRGNYLYVSYYYDGLQVFDMTNPEAPVRAFYYDSSPIPNNSSYQGAWGVHPLKKSGKILLADMQQGLFVFAPVDVSSNTIEPQAKDFTVSPNPVNNGKIYLTLEEAISSDNSTWTLCNPEGRQLLSEKLTKGSKAATIEVVGLPKGMYFLSIKDADKTSTKQIVIDHK
jgi:hypothetical protein